MDRLDLEDVAHLHPVAMAELSRLQHVEALLAEAVITLRILRNSCPRIGEPSLLDELEREILGVLP
jgi:hypothetical protein